MSDLCFLSLAEAAALIRKRRLSPLELTEAHLARIERVDPSLGSYITVPREQALQQAREATERLTRTGSTGPLFGIPISLKDNLPTAGVRTTAASHALEDWIPDRDAFVAGRLRAAGAVMIGKATLSEFAFAGGRGANELVPPPKNPWGFEYSSGGSSNGSAVNVAAGLAMASIGSDSGGSIRIPAAFSGVTGLNPTYGRVGRSGGIPFSYSMGSIGPLSRSAEDAALVLEAIAGVDAADRTSSHRPVPRYSHDLSRRLRGVRIGTCAAYVDAVGVQADTATAIADVMRVFRSLGATEPTDVTIPHLNYSSAAGYNTIMRIEAFHSHVQRMRERRAKYGHAFRNIARGGFLTTHDYLRAQQARTLIVDEVRAAFRQIDVLVLPVTPATPDGGAYAHEGRDEKVRKGSFSHGAAYTAPFNLTGQPALSLPCGFTAKGVPLAVQLVARPFDESLLLAIGHQYQAATDWHRRRPTLTP
jgi:aspartyl-tRNA(Asn)/glutamyl-tRNA(Gln) amidotransferase subunit A